MVGLQTTRYYHLLMRDTHLMHAAHVGYTYIYIVLYVNRWDS